MLFIQTLEQEQVSTPYCSLNVLPVHLRGKLIRFLNCLLKQTQNPRFKNKKQKRIKAKL